MSATTRAVLVTASEPEPRSFGKQVVIGGLLDHLCRRLGADQVHVVLIGRADADRPATPYRIQVLAKPAAAAQARAVFSRVLLPPHSALQEAALWSGHLVESLAAALAGIGADLEIWDTMRTGQYVRAIPAAAGVRRVLYADDLFSKRYATMLDRIKTDPTRVANPLGEFGKVLPGPARRLGSHPAFYRPLLRVERRLTARSEEAAPALFDATVLVNPAETAELRARTGSSRVHTLLPLLREPDDPVRRYDGDPTFVFLGGLDFPPNRDGLEWFLGSCREAVLAEVPDFRLLLVGRGSENPPAAAAAWGDRVRPLGWVDDLDQVLAGAAALLSPLRIGSGIKIKVLEALARGLPVVATPAGVLGLDVADQDGCLIGATPAELAAHLRAAAEPSRNAELSAGAAASWRQRYGPAVAAAAYDEVLGLPTLTVEGSRA